MDKSIMREAFLRFYASITGASYESVRDEYLGKPLPGQDKYHVDNRLFTHIETAVAWALAEKIERERP